MNFNLKTPCIQCPFIKGSSTNVTLKKGRLKGITNDLMKDGSFICHKTTDYPQNKQEHCAGALLYLERLDRPNQMMRIAERIGCYDRTKLIPHKDLIDSYH